MNSVTSFDLSAIFNGAERRQTVDRPNLLQFEVNKLYIFVTYVFFVMLFDESGGLSYSGIWSNVSGLLVWRATFRESIVILSARVEFPMKIWNSWNVGPHSNHPATRHRNPGWRRPHLRRCEGNKWRNLRERVQAVFKVDVFLYCAYGRLNSVVNRT